MKKLILMLMTVFLLSSCSIDRIDTIALDVNTFQTEYVSSTAEFPNGGYWIYFLTNGEITNQIFLSNGNDGKDGINGVDGIDGQDGVSATITSVVVGPTAEYPTGGYLLTFGVGNVTETIFVSNGTNGINGLDGIDGQDGASVIITTRVVDGGTILIITQGTEVVEVFIKDGTNGTNGLNGINGTNGTNASITTETVEGGYNLHITVNGETTTIFVSNGQDGTNGINGTTGAQGIQGIQGIAGTNGTSATIRTEETDGGYNLYITIGGVEGEAIFIKNGVDGTNGLNGTNGQDGQDYTNGDGTVTICHKVTHPVTEHPEWGSNTNVTLTLNLSEYIKHIYEFHNGTSTQNDAWGSCE